MIDKFNIRVYGIWVRNDKILISNENIDGFEMIKLPGGGLEFGEGPIDCLIREFKEELNIQVNIVKLVHTSAYFVQSAFRKNEQVIAIHYLVESKDEISKMETIQTTNVGTQNKHRFEWVDLKRIDLELFTFEMDRLALRAFLLT